MSNRFATSPRDAAKGGNGRRRRSAARPAAAASNRDGRRACARPPSRSRSGPPRSPKRRPATDLATTLPAMKAAVGALGHRTRSLVGGMGDDRRPPGRGHRREAHQAPARTQSRNVVREMITQRSATGRRHAAHQAEGHRRRCGAARRARRGGRPRAGVFGRRRNRSRCHARAGKLCDRDASTAPSTRASKPSWIASFPNCWKVTTDMLEVMLTANKSKRSCRSLWMARSCGSSG